MIELTSGNLLEASDDALVNTVNCVGFMGKGIALQFKQAFPENFRAYQRACRTHEVRPGRMFVFETGQLVPPRYIINFPTKRHWRGRSRIDDIETGLAALVDEVRRLKIRSIAVPPLGTGYGGLDWEIVRPMIIEAFTEAPEVCVHLYAPRGAPDPRTMPVRTAAPPMTSARAIVVSLMDRYLQLAYRLTLLEIQKIAYFTQEAGEPLRLRYQKGHFGPYADNLNKVLERIEGHMIRGYGDSQGRDTEIELVPSAVELATSFLEDKAATRSRLERVSDLIRGFETPYGVELLSTTHWVATHEQEPARTPSQALVAIRSWSDRKAGLYKEHHVATAWDRLVEEHWIDVPSKAHRT